MQFLLIILFLICSVHSLYAQSLEANQGGKKDAVKKQEKILLLDNTNSIFPKSKTNFLINSTFKENTFRVKNVFKQDKGVGFNPSAMQGGGINSQFIKPRKPVDEKTILQEYKDFLKRNKNR
jgi:hypothetical protein